MPQLGKYDTDRDNILHFLCTSGWSNGDFGNVEAPTGYVSRISNMISDVHRGNTEMTSLIEDQLKAYDIEDTDLFRSSLVGHFLVTENDQGFVTVTQFETIGDLVHEFNHLRDQFEAWDTDEEEQ